MKTMLPQYSGISTEDLVAFCNDWYGIHDQYKHALEMVRAVERADPRASLGEGSVDYNKARDAVEALHQQLATRMNDNGIDPRHALDVVAQRWPNMDPARRGAVRQSMVRTVEEELDRRLGHQVP